MKSELDVFLEDVIFRRDPVTGKLRPEGPPGLDLRSVVSERKDAVRGYLFKGERATVWGICDACGLPMALICYGTRCYRFSKRSEKLDGCVIEYPQEDGTVLREMRSARERWERHGAKSNRSGLCWLCECFLQKMIAAGEWPPKRENVVQARNLEEIIAALPPKPKAPWEST